MAQSRTGSREETRLPGKSYQPVRAPRGPRLNCQGWPQEAALRVLMNCLDEEVAERPRELIACGAAGKVLGNWDSYHATVNSLKSLKDHQTLLMQSGEPVGIFETRQAAPRVLIANSNGARRPSVRGKFPDPGQRSLMMPERMAAGSWTYVGPQGVLPIAFQMLDAIGQKHFGGHFDGKLIASGGMGPSGGALSLAAGLHGAAFLGIDANGEKIRGRIREGYCDYCVNTLDEALRILKNAVRQKQPVAVVLVGNCADVIPELARRGVVPDVLTDHSSADDLLNGYIPSGLNLEEAATLRRQNSQDYLKRARDSVTRHFKGMLALQKLGSVLLDSGSGIQTAAHRQKDVNKRAPALMAPVEAFLRPLLSKGLMPVRWIALSGERGDIGRFDDLALKLFPDDALLARWIPLARKYVRFQGIPARVCWLGSQSRMLLAEHVNRMVAEGAFKAPFVIALDQIGSRTTTSSSGKSSTIENQSKAGEDRPFLRALLNTASGASWVSTQAGAGGTFLASLVVVADGTSRAAKAVARVLKTATEPSPVRRASVGRDMA